MSIESIMGDLLVHAPAMIIAIPLLGAFLTPIISRINGTLRNVFVISIMGLTSLFVGVLANDIFTSRVIKTYVFGGSQELTSPVVRILLEIDALSMFMAMIVLIVAFVAVIYSWGFMKEYTGLDKYYTLVLLMTAGMFGMVLTGDLFNFFVFLEITSIASCALIAFWTTKGESIEAAFKYIVISAIGALFVLFAIAILYGQYNALNIATLASVMKYTFLDKVALVLLVGALAMKAGIVPMHMWLPDSYGRAPASVTLILVGATQASLYGVFRVCFTLYGKSLSLTNNILGLEDGFPLALGTSLGILVVLLAIVTMLVGVFMALKQSDFKRLIGFAAVAEIGYMMLGLGVALLSIEPTGLSGSGLMALKGGIFHIFNDALDIGLMFLVAGAVYWATKERSLDKLGGLARNMKYTSIFFVIGLFAVAGMPPFNGFASKLLIYESVFQISPILSIVAILSSIMLLAVFVKVFHSVFLGPAIPKFKNVKEAPISLLVAMIIISVLIVFIGIFPEMFLNNIVGPATDALVNYSGYIDAVVLGGM